MQMFEIRIPSNIYAVFSILIPLAQFDIFESLDIPSLIFHFDNEQHDEWSDEI